MPLNRLSTRDILDSIFQNAPIGMAIVALDGSFLKVNSTLCEMVGYSEEELSLLSFQDITHPDDLAATFEGAQRLYCSNESSYQLEKRYIHKLGHEKRICVYVSLLRDPEDHTPILYMSQMVEIPERNPL